MSDSSAKPQRPPAADHFDVLLQLMPKRACDFVRVAVKEVFDAPEVEVLRQPDPRLEWLFRRCKPLPTYLALHDETRKLPSQKGWTHLFVIAESGAWLTDHYVWPHLTGETARRVLLLQAPVPKEWALRQKPIAQDLEDKWAELEVRNCKVIAGELDWWRHNRHLSLEADAENGLLLGGIFFRRQLKASRIQPVQCEPLDCGELLLSFLHYVERAMESKEMDEAKGRTTRSFAPRRSRPRPRYRAVASTT